MLIEFDLVLTKVGQQALWNSQNTGVDLNLTHIQIGTSSANYGKEYDSTGLDNAVDTVAVAKGQRITDEQIRIFTTIHGNGNHLVTELGVWSGEPDAEGSILFAYVVSKQEDQLAITSKGLSIVFSLDLLFSGEDIENIKIVADQDQSLVLSMLTEHFTDDNAHPYYAHKLQENTFTGTNTFTQEIKGNISGTAQHAVSADRATEADSADFALSAFKAKEAEEALVAEHATTADSAETAYSAFQAQEAETAQVATRANQLTNARTIGLYGAVAGNPIAFNGTANILIETTTVEGSKVSGTVGQANTANRLKEAVNIHGVSFDGSKSIDLPIFTNDKSGLVPNSEYEDGEANKYLCEDGTWKVIDTDSSGGEADHATTADKLKTARTISLSGAITGTPTEFDGSSNISIPVTYVDGSKVTGFVPNATNANSALTASSATNATNATTAVRLTNSRFISIKGNVNSNAVAFNGSADVTLEVTSVAGSIVTGAVPSASKLETKRKIQGVDFDGSSDIALPIFNRDISGLVPSSGGASINRFLCEDGTWRLVGSGSYSDLARWGNYGGERTVGTSYLNATGFIIDVAVYGANYENIFQVSADGFNWINVFPIGKNGTMVAGATATIPHGHYYRLNGGGFSMWAELRS